MGANSHRHCDVSSPHVSAQGEPVTMWDRMVSFTGIHPVALGVLTVCAGGMVVFILAFAFVHMKRDSAVQYLAKTLSNLTTSDQISTLDEIDALVNRAKADGIYLHELGTSDEQIESIKRDIRQRHLERLQGEWLQRVAVLDTRLSEAQVAIERLAHMKPAEYMHKGAHQVEQTLIELREEADRFKGLSDSASLFARIEEALESVYQRSSAPVLNLTLEERRALEVANRTVRQDLESKLYKGVDIHYVRVGIFFISSTEWDVEGELQVHVGGAAWTSVSRFHISCRNGIIGGYVG